MNNVQLITLVIAFVSLLLTIIAGAWLNQRGLERQMEAFRQEMKAEFASLRAEIQAVNNRIATLESRVERIERQLDQIFKPSLPKSGD